MRNLAKKRRFIWVGIGVIVGTVAVFATQAKPKLFVEGKLASTDVVIKNGQAYGRLGDIAKAMGMVVVKRAEGFELKRAGGANPIEGITGKIGDTLFDGNFQFKVLEVVRAQTYQKRFDGGGGTVEPLSPSDDVLAVICRVKNGMKKTVTLLFPGGQNTTVTDMEEHSFGPFTGLAVDLRARGENMVPGSAVDFALTFSIPKSAVLKDLLWQIDLPENVKKTTFRVSLKQD